MPDFQNPVAFLLLLLIPVLFVLRYIGFFSRMSFVAVISDWAGKTFEWNKEGRRFASVLSTVCGCLGFVVAVVALAEPVLYRQERVYTSRGTDILFVLDVSPSMAAKDIAGGTRIEAAKKSVAELVTQNQGATFGLVAMGGEASIVVPPTIDQKIFMERLEAVEIGSLGNGTAIGTGLATAVYHLSSSVAPKKCIVLITDGENNSGEIHPETAAELAQKNNITVYTLGIGTSGSVPIEYFDAATGRMYTGYLNSNFDPSVLRLIAQAGGGRFFEIQSLSDFSLALSVIIKNQNVVQSYHSKTINFEFYDKLILLSGIFLMLSWIIRRIFLQEFL